LAARVLSLKSLRNMTNVERDQAVAVSYSRREVLVTICAALGLSGTRDSHASEPSLEHDQGFVLCAFHTNEPVLIRSIEFRQFHAQPLFSVGTWPPDWLRDAPPAAPSIVKLGRYYLSGSWSGFANVGKTLYKEPADERGTFEVLNGVVNYIGDWFVTRQGVDVKVRLPTILSEKRRYPWLEDHQLFVSVPGRESFALSWGQVDESARR